MDLLPIVDSEKVELLYQSRSMKMARGSSALLNCEAVYDPVQCEDVHVAWFQGTTELTRPRKYITAVNESFHSEPVQRRRRQVETEILDLQPEDAARFQCKALCVGELTAMGHFISITITGDSQSGCPETTGSVLELQERIQTGNVANCKDLTLLCFFFFFSGRLIIREKLSSCPTSSASDPP